MFLPFDNIFHIWKCNICITFAYGMATRLMFFVIQITHYMTHNAMIHSQTEVAVTR